VIKRVKNYGNALLASKEFRNFVEKFESEINRGISKLCILSIIAQSNSAGIHGYQILKILEERTDGILIIEEGTLYPILRKLKDDGIITSRKEKTGRKRTFYFMTEAGKKKYNYISGYFSKLTEAISSLFDVQVSLKQDRYIFCPMCANKLDRSDKELRFCDVCGHNIEKELKERSENK